MRIRNEIKTRRHQAQARVLVILFFAFAFLLPAPSPARAPGDPELLETGSARKLRTPPAQAPQTIKIVTYNMRWRGGEDLRELIGLLRNDATVGSAQIIGLQEIDRNKKRTQYTNTARMMAEELGLHYAWAAPPLAPDKKRDEEEETGVAILSIYPLSEVTRIVLPNEGPGGRRRVALGATVTVGPYSLRVYSVHAETRTTNERRLQQFQAVLDDLSRHAKTERAVVLGDFNTITGDDVRATTRLFTAANFQTPFPNGEPTWKTFILKLKLDWMWLRGLRAVDYGIDRKIELSDHWPLWAIVKLGDEKGETEKRSSTSR